MAKSTKFHAAERIDLVDLHYGVGDYSVDLQGDLLRGIYGAGILDGFRVKVLDKGQAPAALEIYNGRAINWNGQYIESETGTKTERVVLTRASTEYWIEIEFLWVDADFDSRAFWDPLVSNGFPLLDGQEVSIPRVTTRRIPAWRVKTPINSNPIGNRSDPGYAPSRFTNSSENTVPIAVIRTDAAGNIVNGNPNTTSDGNDISVYTTAEGIDQWFVKFRGYGETGSVATDAGGNDWVYGLKTSDQRPRMFESILPPYRAGYGGEIAGTDTLHDGWVRDLKSMYDHITGQIAQVKLGANLPDMGTYHGCTMSAMAVDLTSVVLDNITDNAAVPAAVPAQADQFMGATFQIVDSATGWNGFYARISGNEKIDGFGKTTLYLEPTSPIPDWMDLPDFTLGSIVCYIVQYKQKNWLTKPCPSSAYRGLNALDTEVVAGRTDWWSAKTFERLSSRMNAGKMATLTVAPVDAGGINATTGEPVTVTHPRADVFESIADIKTKVNTVVSLNKSGTVHFRAGTYDFNSILDTISVFEVKNVEGFTFEGVGPQRTILQRTTTTGAIFEVEGSNDVVFKDMAIIGLGTVMSFISCNRVRFINCIIQADADDFDTIAINLGAANSFFFKDSLFTVTGEGISASLMNSCEFSGCTFADINGNPAETKYIMNVGSVTDSSIHDCLFRGFVDVNVFRSSSFERSHFHNNSVRCNTTLNGTGVLRFGDVSRSRIIDVPATRYSSDLKTQVFIFCGDVSYSIFENISADNVKGGFVASSLDRTCLKDIIIDSLTGGDGIHILGNVSYSMIDHCTLSGEGSVAAAILIEGEMLQLLVCRNQIRGATGPYPYGISLNNGVAKLVAVIDNQFMNVDRAIQITNVQDGENIYVRGNKADTGANYAFSFKFLTTVYQFTCIDNECLDYALGITIEATSCIMERCFIDHNMLRAFTRPLEIWATSGGEFNFGSISDNTCIGRDIDIVALGVDQSSAIAAKAAVPFVVYNSHILKNRVTTTAAVLGGLWVSKTYRTAIDESIIAGNITSYGLKVADRVDDGSICGNKVDLLTGLGHALHVVGVLANSIIEKNHMSTSGANFHGLYLEAASLQNSIVNNQAYGNGAAGTFSFYMKDAADSVITNNLSINWNKGFQLENGADSIVASNFFKTMTGGVFIETFVTGSNLLGGSTVPVVDPAYSDSILPAPIRNLSTYNWGI